MKKTLGVLLLVFISHVLLAQDVITTFILVRHAEKDLTQSTSDPDLSAEGKNRATRLSELLKKTDITAVYSTPYKRTQQTVAVLAAEKNLTVASYQASKMEEIDNILKQHAGGTILISGHSNTTPAVLNYLIGEEKHKMFDDSDYGNVVIVSLVTRGKNAKVTWVRY